MNFVLRTIGAVLILAVLAIVVYEIFKARKPPS